jgi:hypothetical protein
MNSPHLKKTNINSGYCQFWNNSRSNIVIYRTEEIIKVTIHELIHGLRFDYSGSSSDPNELIKHYENKYNITLDAIRSNEAYTEIWANILHSYLLSKLFGKNRLVFIILLQYEKLFAMLQYTKIKSLIKNKSYEIDKHTNVTAYFIIRAELFRDINQFLRFCRLSNKRYLKITHIPNYIKYLFNLQNLNIHLPIHKTLKDTARMSGFSISI